MIPELYRAPNADPAVQKALEHLHKNAVQFNYLNTTTATAVPTGQFVISDTGSTAGGQVVYVRTSQNNVIGLKPPLATATNVTVADGTLASATAQINAILVQLKAIGAMHTA